MPDKDKQPVYRNAHMLVWSGIFVATLALVGEFTLILLDRPMGLPEVITTAMFSLASSIVGYAGACIQLRQGEDT